jgi:hypothetical protein
MQCGIQMRECFGGAAAGSEKQHAQIVMGAREIRLELDDFLELGNRLKRKSVERLEGRGGDVLVVVPEKARGARASKR